MSEEFDSERIRELVEELDDVTAELRETGGDVPAIERNTMRIEAIIDILNQHVPPELDGGGD